jgi:hypothetical protein
MEPMHLWENNVYRYAKVPEACIRNHRMRRDKRQRETDHHFELKEGLIAEGPSLMDSPLRYDQAGWVK